MIVKLYIIHLYIHLPTMYIILSKMKKYEINLNDYTLNTLNEN